VSALASSPLSTPFTGVSGAGDPLGGITPFGFQIPQGSPGEIEAASDTCRHGAIGLLAQGQGVGQGTQLAVAGWQGNAQAAFSGYATLAGMVLETNTRACSTAASALDELASELARAQKITRQAASDCERYQQQLTAAEQEHSLQAQEAQNFSQQAALAAHPHIRSQLNQQATAASDLAQAAQGQASRARAGVEAASQQGRDAARAYQQQAEGIASRIKAAGDQIGIVERMPGGAPIPIDVTPGDVNVAKRILRGAGNLATAAKAARDPALLRRLAGGALSPAAASVFLHALHIDEEEAEKPELGNLWDAAGGFLHAASFGIINFGNPDTARYRAGEIDAAIPVDPDSLGVDGADAARVAEDGERALGEGAEAAAVDPAKFSDYIFKEGADHGKDAIFRSYGYGPGDSEELAETYRTQAATQYADGNYTLGKLDQYGQRITVDIRLQGQGVAAGRSTIVKAGFMIDPDGSIRLITPFAGFGQ
jgi:hypothetical protein